MIKISAIIIPIVLMVIAGIVLHILGLMNYYSGFFVGGFGMILYFNLFQLLEQE